MELQQLQHFLSLARTGNIGRAADELHITHSGLSRSIKTLEDFLGVRLFLRQSRGVSLTPFGQALIPRATHILNERSRAIRELGALRSLRAGHVEIALDPIFDDTFAASVIGAFMDQFPTVEVDLFTASEPDVTQRLSAGDFDFAFTVLNPEGDPPGLVQEVLLELPFAICMREGHPLAGQSPDARALAEAEWLLLGTGAFRRRFDAWFADLGLPPPTRVLQCPSLSMLRLLLGERDSLAVLPAFIVQAPGSGLTVLEEPFSAVMVEAGLVYRKGSFHSLSAYSLLEIFRQRAAGFG